MGHHLFCYFGIGPPCCVAVRCVLVDGHTEARRLAYRCAFRDDRGKDMDIPKVPVNQFTEALIVLRPGTIFCKEDPLDRQVRIHAFFQAVDDGEHFPSPSQPNMLASTGIKTESAQAKALWQNKSNPL